MKELVQKYKGEGLKVNFRTFEKLTKTEIMVYSYMSMRACRTGQFFQSTNNTAKKLNLLRPNVSKAVKKLTELGLVENVGVTETGVNIYQVYIEYTPVSNEGDEIDTPPYQERYTPVSPQIHPPVSNEGDEIDTPPYQERYTPVSPQIHPPVSELIRGRKKIRQKDPNVLKKYYPGFVVGEGYILDDELDNNNKEENNE